MRVCTQWPPLRARRTARRGLVATLAAGAVLALAPPAFADGDLDPPDYTVDDVTVDESAGQASFTVTRNPLALGFTVDYDTVDGSAKVADGDYESASGTLDFSTDASPQTVSVPIEDDALGEPAETFVLQLSNGSDDTGTGTISASDTPTVSAGDAPAAESDANAEFTLTLSNASSEDVTVDYATTDGTAVAGGDYTATSGTATFPAGETTAEVPVPLSDDALDEDDEGFTLDLSDPQGATVADGQGSGTIADDDAPPEVSLDDAGSVTEGDSGSTEATFEVSLDAPSGRQVTVEVATEDGTAKTSDGDYTAADETVTFAAGDTSEEVAVDVHGDTRDEPNETFEALATGPSNADLGDDDGSATITDDDESPPGPDPFVPAPDTGAAPIPDPQPQGPTTVQLSDEWKSSTWAYVERRTVARREPDAGAKARKVLRTITEDYTPELVLLLELRRNLDGSEWVRARLPMRPNGTTGWIPREDLSEFRQVNTAFRISRNRFRASLFRDGKKIWSARIGVGKRKWPTPRGRFYVRERLIPRNKRGIYGVFAFGTSAYSPVLTDWPGGGVVGIHGTNQPGLIPGRISHGCVRVRNRRIARLRRLMPLGTPIRIR